MKSIISIFIIALFASCSNNYKKNIVGEWYKVDDWINTGEKDTDTTFLKIATQRPPFYLPFGFNFFNNDSVEYFFGVWKKTDSLREYLGRFRRYHIIEDSLFIYNLDKKLYHKTRIGFKGKDTLISYKKNKKYTFVRFQSKINKEIRIDSISVILNNGWGLNIEYKLSKDCKIEYLNKPIGEPELDFVKSGYISVDEFKTIELKYQKTNFPIISDYGGCCDNYSFTTIIYYNNGNKKKIYDYESQSPMKLLWANRYLMTIIENQLKIKQRY